MALILQLKSDSGLYQDAGGTTPATSDTDPVGLWQDQSGAGNHFSQSTDAARPILKTAVFNSGPAIRFDGAASYLAAANFSSATDGFLITVLQVPSGGSSGAIFASSDEAGTTNYQIMRINTGAAGNTDIHTVAAGTQNRVVTTMRVDLDIPIVLAHTSTGTLWRMMANGSLYMPMSIATGSNNGSWFGDISGRDNYTIGVLKRSSLGTYAAIDVAELRLYDSFTNYDDIRSIMETLMTTYSIDPDAEERIMNLVKVEL